MSLYLYAPQFLIFMELKMLFPLWIPGLQKGPGRPTSPQTPPSQEQEQRKHTHTHTYTCVLHKQPQYKAVSSKGWGMKGMLGELRRNFSCWGGGQGLSRIKINSHLQCTFPVSGIFCTYFNCMANGKEELGFRFCR